MNILLRITAVRSLASCHYRKHGVRQAGLPSDGFICCASHCTTSIDDLYTNRFAFCRPVHRNKLQLRTERTGLVAGLALRSLCNMFMPTHAFPYYSVAYIVIILL